MMPAAELVHALPGRLRFRVPEMRGDADWFREVGAGLESYPGIRSVQATPLTASILVTGRDLAVRQVSALAESRGWFRLAPPGARPTFDLTKPVALGLLALAFLQVVRGQTLAPAASLAWYASQVGR